MAGVPGKPGDIKLLKNTMSWGRPQTTDVPFEYVVIIVDTNDDSLYINEVCSTVATQWY